MSSIRFIIISLVAVIALLLVGCAGKSSQTAKESDRQPQPTDTLYTQKVAMSIYGYQPVWALQIIDSAVVVGNLSEVWADVNRARIYSQTQMKEQLDSLLGGPEGVRLDTARTIGERLLQHDSLKANSKLRQDVLEILVYTARQQQDTVRWLQRSRELVEECRKHGDEAKALRTEAELGASLCYSGQQEQGLALLDSVIAALMPPNLGGYGFNELDAYIIAAKRKIGVLSTLGREVETLPLSRRIIELLDDYEQNPDQYHDGSSREPDNDTKRADYIRFYRSQAQGFITAAYTALDGKDNMTEAYEKIERTVRDDAAREHLARYRALEQQLETERQTQRAEQQQTRANHIRHQAIGVFIVALLAVSFSIILFRKNRVIGRKNRALVRQIDEALKYKELYRLEHQQNGSLPVGEGGGRGPAAADMGTFTSEQLFQHINEVIVGERLFLDPKFGRQTIIDRFQLSKDRVGAAFAQGSCHDSLTDYVQELRLEYAARLLTEQPRASITQVAGQSGYTSAQYFSRRFRQRFGMSPSDYREAHLPDA